MKQVTIPKLMINSGCLANNNESTTQSSRRTSSYQGRPSKYVISEFQLNSGRESPTRNIKIQQSVKINQIFHKQIGKLKLSQKDRSQKFDDRLKTFENISTFVDIREYLQQMNKTNVTARALQQSNFLPSVDNKSNEINALSVRETDTFCPEKNLCVSSRTIKAHRMANRTLSEARHHFIRNTEGDEDLFISQVLNTAAEDLENMNKSTMNSVINEDFRADGMSHMFNEIANKKEKEAKLQEMNRFRAHEEDVNYVKDQLKFIPVVQTECDEHYYKEYKQRADKIIVLLKSASRRVYNKTSQELLGQKVVKEKDIRSKKIDLKKDLQPILKDYMSKNNFTQGDYLSSVCKPEETLRSKFNRMQTRINTLRPIDQEQLEAAQNKGDESTKSLADKQQNDKLNRQVNRLHKSFMNKLITKVETEGTQYKDLKRQLKGEINVIEESYNNSMEQIFPQDMITLKDLNLNYTPSRFDKQAFRKFFSKDALSIALKHKN